MYLPINVEPNVGDIVNGILPMRKKGKNLDIVQGKVLDIEYPGMTTQPKTTTVPGDRDLIINCKMLSDGTYKKFRIAEYRIYEFTFGGIMVYNPKFDQDRIELEDNIKIGVFRVV